jgi:DTW domain-containing protein YfiP
LRHPFASSPHRGRAGAVPRCLVCGLQDYLCLCAELVPLQLGTRVVVVRTPREKEQLTNSGRLVPLALANAALRERDELAEAEFADPSRRALLLFPAPDAPELAHDPSDPRPITLVVPDGTWRATRRMVAREPALATLPRVTLPAGAPTRYRLRTHPNEHCLATLEATARALGLLEGPEVEQHLTHLFTLFVERTLWSRGRIRAADVTGGVPQLPSRAPAQGQGSRKTSMADADPM